MLEGRTHKAVVELFRTAGEEVELLIQKKVGVRSYTLRSERLTACYIGLSSSRVLLFQALYVIKTILKLILNFTGNKSSGDVRVSAGFYKQSNCCKLRRTEKCNMQNKSVKVYSSAGGI